MVANLAFWCLIFLDIKKAQHTLSFVNYFEL